MMLEGRAVRVAICMECEHVEGYEIGPAYRDVQLPPCSKCRGDLELL